MHPHCQRGIGGVEVGGREGGRAGEGKGTPKVMVAINTHVTDGSLTWCSAWQNQQSVGLCGTCSVSPRLPRSREVVTVPA